MIKKKELKLYDKNIHLISFSKQFFRPPPLSLFLSLLSENRNLLPKIENSQSLSLLVSVTTHTTMSFQHPDAPRLKLRKVNKVVNYFLHKFGQNIALESLILTCKRGKDGLYV